MDVVIFLESPLAEEILAAMGTQKMELLTCATLQEAVQIAQKKTEAGDRVLLSPAGEYFVYFKDKMPGYKNFRDILERLSLREVTYS